MSYSDDYKDQQHERFLERWTPYGIGRMPVTAEQLRFTLAKLHEAEHKLAEFEAAKATLQALVR